MPTRKTGKTPSHTLRVDDETWYLALAITKVRGTETVTDVMVEGPGLRPYVERHRHLLAEDHGTVKTRPRQAHN